MTRLNPLMSLAETHANNKDLFMTAGKTGSGISMLIAALLKQFGKEKSVHALEYPPEIDFKELKQ